MSQAVAEKKRILGKYIPEEAIDQIIIWQDQYNFKLRISKDRKSKLGDFRPPYQGYGYRISVNRSLNKYSFLITLVHEIAHLVTWEKFKDKVQPHGNEWKNSFRILMDVFIQKQFIPKEIEILLLDYLQNPAASSCRDEALMRALRKWDENPATYLEELPDGAEFIIHNGRKFIKGEKRRKRYICLECATERKYLFSPVAEVIHIKK